MPSVSRRAAAPARRNGSEAPAASPAAIPPPGSTTPKKPPPPPPPPPAPPPPRRLNPARLQRRIAEDPVDEMHQVVRGRQQHFQVLALRVGERAFDPLEDHLRRVPARVQRR